ncbi:c-type cytochrome [Parahaliea maris]|uniref:C-type cytochrome n=1 Tax=Parahaliea maris TaxID=2716870 RepID=A0A5C8ZU36_9GAMM|nr:c-type cytochrome [Parahaliea maris]TXS91966.1 c-type cytochrome [Parahaliea maris]
MRIRTMRGKLGGVGLLALSLAGAASWAQAEDDPALAAKGKQFFMLCQSCHAIDDSSGMRIGPHLKGVYGRPVAALDDFSYSAALREQDFAWDGEKLDAWLKRPYDLVPGSSMSFAGVASEDMRKALIAYLKTL